MKANIIDNEIGLTEFACEMPHGRKDECNFLLMVADVGRLFGDLDHENEIALRVKAAQRGDIVAELVAEDKHQRSYFAQLDPPFTKSLGMTNASDDL